MHAILRIYYLQIGDRFSNYSSNKQTISFAEVKQFLLDEQKVGLHVCM